MQQATPSTAEIPVQRADTADPDALRYGRMFGALVLAAFILYGVGSSLADQPIGLVLVGVNSVAVALIGGIGFGLLRSSRRRVGRFYLAARFAEAILLFVGVAIAGAVASPDFDQNAYQLAMIALGVGSIPFVLALKHGRWLPGWFAVWGVIGYAALAAGALLELASGRSVAVALAVPGGLFELALGVFLLWRGFSGVNTRSPHAIDEPWSESL